MVEESENDSDSIKQNSIQPQATKTDNQSEQSESEESELNEVSDVSDELFHSDTSESHKPMTRLRTAMKKMKNKIKLPKAKISAVTDRFQ